MLYCSLSPASLCDLEGQHWISNNSLVLPRKGKYKWGLCNERNRRLVSDVLIGKDGGWEEYTGPSQGWERVEEVEPWRLTGGRVAGDSMSARLGRQLAPRTRHPPSLSLLCPCLVTVSTRIQPFTSSPPAPALGHSSVPLLGSLQPVSPAPHPRHSFPHLPLLATS